MDAGDFAAFDLLLDQALDRPEVDRGAWVECLPRQVEHLKPRLRSLLASTPGGTSPVDRLPAIALHPGDDEGGERSPGPARAIRSAAT
jgi:hypothetical protein